MLKGRINEYIHKKTKKEKPEPRVFVIPREKLKRFYALWDKSKNGGKLEKFELWLFIEELFPETGTDSWQIDTHSLFHPNVTKKL